MMGKLAQKSISKVRLPFRFFFLGLTTALFAFFALAFFIQNEKLKRELKINREEMAQMTVQVSDAQKGAESLSSLQTKNFARLSLFLFNRIETKLKNTWLFLVPNQLIIDEAGSEEIKALLLEAKETLAVFVDLPQEAEELRQELFALDQEVRSLLPQVEDLTKIDLEREAKNKSAFYQRAADFLRQKDKVKTKLIRLSGGEVSFSPLPFPTALPTTFLTPRCSQCGQ